MSHCRHIERINQDLFLATNVGGAILAIGWTCVSHSFEYRRPVYPARWYQFRFRSNSPNSRKLSVNFYRYRSAYEHFGEKSWVDPRTSKTNFDHLTRISRHQFCQWKSETLRQLDAGNDSNRRFSELRGGDQFAIISTESARNRAKYLKYRCAPVKGAVEFVLPSVLSPLAQFYLDASYVCHLSDIGCISYLRILVRGGGRTSVRVGIMSPSELIWRDGFECPYLKRVISTVNHLLHWGYTKELDI